MRPAQFAAELAALARRVDELEQRVDAIEDDLLDLAAEVARRRWWRWWR